MSRANRLAIGLRRSAETALRLGCAAAAAAFATAGMAAEKPRLIPDWKQSHLEEGDQTVQSIYRLAACARVLRRDTAEAVLETVPGSREEHGLLKAAVPPGWGGCPIKYRKLRIRSVVLMRGALAEALYNGGNSKPRAAALPLAEAGPIAGATSLAIARWVARCAVSRNPGLAHEVVKWNPGGIGEGRALRMLKSTFIDCLPEDQRLQVSRVNMRALIADELYRASRTFKESFAYAHR